MSAPARPRLRPFLLAALALLAAGAARADDPPPVAPPDARPEVIGKVLTDLMAFHHVPGASLALIEGGKIAWAKGYGLKEADGKDGVDEHTMFQAASLSKCVTAFEALRLVDAKILALDADVNTVLAGWKVPDDDFTAEKKVTLRLLLAHAAGTTVHGFGGYRPDQPIPTFAQVLDGLPPANSKPIRVERVPGTKYVYSGGGYLIVQQMLLDAQPKEKGMGTESGKERGKEFPQLMRDRLLGPLEMKDSIFEQPLAAERAHRAASGHGGDGKALKTKWKVYPELAAAGLWTTPSDLARVVTAIFDSLGGREGALLSKETAQEMITPQVLSSPMGLGLLIGGSEAALRFSHDGANAGFHCRLVGLPATGQGLVLMLNGERAEQILDGVVSAVAREYAWP